MMVVNVEDRHWAVYTQHLGGDGGIVEVAIAAAEILARMMPGRAAQRVRRALIIQDQICGSDCALRRTNDRLKCAFHQRCALIERVIAILITTPLRSGRRKSS